MALQHLRSSTANKRPVPGNMSEGQLAINTASGSPSLFFKDSNANLVKVGPVHVGTTAPNASPASGGTAGNSVGEQWLDTSSSRYVFKIWDGSAWRSEDGEFVNASGDVMTGALGIIAGTAGSPGLYFSGDTNTGVYSPGADQVAISTNGTGRLFVDASGQIGIGASPSYLLDVASSVVQLGFSTDAFVQYKSTAGNWHVGANSSNAYVFYSGTYGTGTERMRLDSSGRLGLGTSSPNYQLHVTTTFAVGASGFNQQLTFGNDTIQSLLLGTGYTPLKLNPLGGNVGIGTTSPTDRLTVVDGTNIIVGAGALALNNYTNEGAGFTFGRANDGTRVMALGVVDTDKLLFAGREGLLFAVGGGGVYSAVTEAARIDSSGRLLVGTSSGRNVGTVYQSRLQIETNQYAGLSIVNNTADTGPALLSLAKSRGTSVGATNLVQANDVLGTIAFSGADGTDVETAAAEISVQVDGTPGTNDMPGRLVFSTTADGASSPTERMRIASDGAIYFQTTATPSTSSYGTVISSGNVLLHSRNTTSAVAQFYGSSGENRLLGNGSIQNTLNRYGAISDAKLKENIEAAGSQWDDLKALEVVNFNFIGSDQRQIGLVAQQVELISPASWRTCPTMRPAPPPPRA
jgi:hypothetical protein